MPVSPAKPGFILEPLESWGLRLRTIGPADAEILRQWKNFHRHAFFHQDIISPEQQAIWLAGHAARPDDFMFMVEVEGRAVGCLGWRLLEGRADIYNVMLGEASQGGRGLMGRALNLMCRHILSLGQREIAARVLKGNPAVGWYERNGFVLAADHDAYYEMKLNPERLAPCPFRRLPQPSGEL